MKAWISIWILISSGMVMYSLSSGLEEWYMRLIVYLTMYIIIASIFIWYKERLFK